MQSEEDFSIVSRWAYLADVPRYRIGNGRNERTDTGTAALFGGCD